MEIAKRNGPADFLIEEFERRKNRNNKYSLRAYARDAGIAHSFLSHFMTGKRGFSDEMALEVGKKLHWSSTKRRLFAGLCRRQNAKSPESCDLADCEIAVLRSDDLSPHVLQEDQIQIVAHWQHFAIVELINLKDFKNDEKWIAKKLGISVAEVGESLARLARAGVLRKTISGWKRNHEFYSTGDIPSAAIRSFHKQHLDHGKRAIENQPPEARDFRGTTMAIDPEHLPQLRQLIWHFHKEFLSLADKGKGEKKAVFHLSSQFFRLDRDGEI